MIRKNAPTTKMTYVDGIDLEAIVLLRAKPGDVPMVLDVEDGDPAVAREIVDRACEMAKAIFDEAEAVIATLGARKVESEK